MFHYRLERASFYTNVRFLLSLSDLEVEGSARVPVAHSGHPVRGPGVDAEGLLVDGGAVDGGAVGVGDDGPVAGVEGGDGSRVGVVAQLAPAGDGGQLAGQVVVGVGVGQAGNGTLVFSKEGMEYPVFISRNVSNA